MFCNYCQNLMNITSLISNNDESQTNTTITPSKKGHYEITEEDINNILKNDEIVFTISQESYDELLENPIFFNLTGNQKTIIMNRLMDKLSKNPKYKNINKEKEYYYYCDNCGFNTKIPPKTLIYSNKTTEIDKNFINYKYDNTLPKSKNYNCPNDKCKTHLDVSLKEATFYRINNTYNLRYICHSCDTFW